MSYPVASREIPSPMASFSSFRPIFKQSIFLEKERKTIRLIWVIHYLHIMNLVDA